MVLQNILVLISEEALFTSNFMRQRSFTIKDLKYSSFLYLVERAHVLSFPVFRLQIEVEREIKAPLHIYFS